MVAILQYGLSVAVVGICTVFVGLVILIALIKLLEIVVGSATKKTEKPAAAAAPAPAPVTLEEPEAREDEGELIAVIAAAVALAMEAAGEESASGFVVRSIRRVNNAPAWNRAGREEQVYSRM